MEYSTMLQKLDKFLSIADKAIDGIEIIKNIRDSLVDEDIQTMPDIPSEIEISELLNESSDLSADDTVALNTYLYFAAPLKKISDYISENCVADDTDMQEFFKALLPYIAELYYHIGFLFKQCRKIKLRSKDRGAKLSAVSFMAKLLCEHDSLGGYSLDFLTDVSELIDFILTFTDAFEINNDHGSFKDWITSRSELICENFQCIENINLNVSEKERKKLLKTHINTCNRYVDACHINFTRAFYKIIETT